MSELIVSRQQQVLLLTLNRPAARNALNNALLTQLVNELEIVSQQNGAERRKYHRPASTAGRAG